LIKTSLIKVLGMNTVKKALGIVWLLLAPAVIYFLFQGAITHIDPAGKKEINNPVIWIIVITIFTPIAIGLMIFGYYAVKGEYDRLPESSSEL
jgi:phosphate/sulfate permease